MQIETVGQTRVERLRDLHPRVFREMAGAAHRDTDTVDLLTVVITEIEKHAWFLRASLEG